MLKKRLVETLDETLDGDDENADVVVPEFVKVLGEPGSPLETAEELNSPCEVADEIDGPPKVDEPEFVNVLEELESPFEVAEELDIPLEVTEGRRVTTELGVPGLDVPGFVEEEAVKPIDAIVFVDKELLAGALE